MELEAKKGILLSIIAATEKDFVIDHLITVAWQLEIDPGKSILQKEGKKPLPPKMPKKKSIIIHGQEYRSLRFACLEIWGMEDKDYNKISRQVKEGVDIHDLLAPRREPERKRLPADKMGIAITN